MTPHVRKTVKHIHGQIQNISDKTLRPAQQNNFSLRTGRKWRFLPSKQEPLTVRQLRLRAASRAAGLAVCAL